MAVDPTQVIWASTLDTLKNYDTTTGSLSIPSTSYSPGQYKAYQTTLSLTYADGLMMLLQNFSYESSRWYVGTFIQTNPDANFLAQTRATINGSTITIDCYVVNNTGGVVSNPAFTIDFEVRRFVGPFN